MCEFKKRLFNFRKNSFYLFLFQHQLERYIHEVRIALIQELPTVENVKCTPCLAISDDIEPTITEVLFENIGEEVVAKICGSRMWFVYDVSIKDIINGDGQNLKVDVMKSSEFEVQTTMRESNICTKDTVRVRVKTHFQNSKYLRTVKVPAKESVCIFYHLFI